MSSLWLLLALACRPDAPAAPAAELCNGIDDDGDDEVDEDFDQDGDGASTCAARSGALDCNDLDARQHPSAAERCDGIDDDCDGVVPASEQDLDHDGWMACAGDCDDRAPGLSPTDADQDGWSTCEGDCDDSRTDLAPDAPELCNGVDDDCDGSIAWSEGDNDQDGALACAGDCDDLDPRRGPFDADGDGLSACDGDCDDRNATRSPTALERCNELDDDCDGLIDEPDATDAQTWYPDEDWDGFGNAEWPTESCTRPRGWVLDRTDCLDARSDVHPGAPEVCQDGFDNDCNGAIDDACAA